MYIAEQLRLCTGHERILELGAGSSVAAAVLHAYGLPLNRLLITDAEPSMLAHSKIWELWGATLQQADATALPFDDESFDLAIASLADPYNQPAAWKSIAKVLAPSGRVIATMPSHDWAARYRLTAGDDPDTATFVLRDGSVARLPSYVPELSEQIAMMKQASLLVSRFESLGASKLEGEVLSPKLSVAVAPRASLLWGITAVRL
ncbi:MAG: class I SAM-dependent methyltransferase [Burkholderiaceae bacterium]|nr:class I SAM-dependent methyltransferase [Burkholderiaceae bacterium]